MIAYAVAADLRAWVGVDPPANALNLLRSASILVRRATLTAIYDVDTAGSPTDPAVIDALRDATCSQVATWIALAIDPAKGAADAGKTIAAKSLGSASVQYSTYAATVQARADAATELNQEALLILADGGLAGVRPGATR